MMDFVKLQLPPGVARRGTEYSVQGRYYDADLARWVGGVVQPIGGWREISNDDEDTISGAPRAITSWLDKSNQIWAAVGTHTGLFVMTQTGIVHDITPSGFTQGRESSSYGGGYGSGNYGAMPYGTARSNVSVINLASMWTLDVFDDLLIGCMAEDGNIYEWGLNTATAATAVANAPSAKAVMMTNDLFVMALGADGDPRKVQWSGRGAKAVWTPAADNLAGSTRLQTNGKLVCGKRIRGGELLFTTVDVHQAQYVGSPSVYVFERLASGCGIVSPQAAAVVGSRAFWMTKNNFWQFNGYAEPLPCDVLDYVFENINTSQISKAYAVHNSAFGEVWWFYPSASSLECDSYVTFNYLEGHWNIGKLSRTCGTNEDVFAQPLMVDPDGQVYEHEIGNARDGRQGYARAAPIEMGDGERFMYAREYVPDEGTAGDSTVLFRTRMYPNAAETLHGPYEAANPKLVRFGARQVAWEYLFEDGKDARIGAPRLKIKAGGRR